MKKRVHDWAQFREEIRGWKISLQGLWKVALEPPG